MTDFRPSRFNILPTVVKNLIIINSLIVLATFVLGKAGIDIADYLGLHYWRSHYFKPWQFVTHMFLHGSYHDVNGTIVHLFSNMFALWMFGSILENLWGPKRFLIFYLICGLGAAVLHLGVVAYEFRNIEQAFMVYQGEPNIDHFGQFLDKHVNLRMGNPLSLRLYQIRQLWEGNPSANLSGESVSAINQYLFGTVYEKTYFPGIYDEATVGASGAVFGILFAFGYLFPNTLLYLYFLVPIKAKYVVAAYALFELYAGIRNSAGDNIAHFAHLGGMLVAFILLKIWNKNNRNHFY
ncbi:MAG: Rhomboid family protein [Flavipsychrobacter sp.]|jgi:membrane associated rhomboid family serine protease|nr:Rhomboid family protein [Flavipsychrobacter sp.]